MLEGVLDDDDGSCAAGTSSGGRRAAATRPGRPSGCVVLGIFQVPNKFFEDGGRIADVLGQDWEAAWGHAGNLGSAAARTE